MSNEAKITMDEARDLVSNQMLWPLVRDFLWTSYRRCIGAGSRVWKLESLKV